MRFYLKYLCCRKVDNFLYSCLHGDIFKVFLYLLHGWRNKSKPDVIFIIPLVIMGYSLIPVDGPGKVIDFVFRNLCRAKRTDKP